MLEVRLIAIGIILAVSGALVFQWNHMKSKIEYFEQETTRLETSLNNYKDGITKAREDIESLKESRTKIENANRVAMTQLSKIRKDLEVRVSQESARSSPVELQQNINAIMINALDCIEILSGKVPREGDRPCE